MLMLVLKNKHCTIFTRIFCVMFLIDGVKPNVEKKLKTFYVTVLGRGVRSVHNKINFVSYYFWFDGGNINIIQKEQEIQGGPKKTFMMWSRGKVFVKF